MKETENKSSGWSSMTAMLICATAIAVVAGGILIWWRYAAPSTAKYQPIIARLESNQMMPDSGAESIDLAKDYPGVTPRDQLMVTRRSDGSFLALFPTFYGRGPELAGLMYTSRPLRAEDCVHRLDPNRFTDRVIGVGTYGALLIDDRIDDHWYRVSYHMR